MSYFMRRYLAPLLLCLLPATGLSVRASAVGLTFEQRVAAQRAIERIYQSHRLGTDASTEAAVPAEVLEKKVRTYLAQSEALSSWWNSPLTTAALHRELGRIRTHTLFSERLSQIQRALGDDETLLAETLARASLADRLARAFLASDERIQPRQSPLQMVDADEVTAPLPAVTWDEWWSEAAPLYEATAMGRAQRQETMKFNGLSRDYRPSEPLQPDGMELGAPPPESMEALSLQDLWSGGGAEAVPEARSGATAVWTGSEMILWGGRSQFPLNTGSRYDPLTDTWTAMTLVGAPSPRSGHSAVWTGRELIVWGGEEGAVTGGRYDPASDSWRPTATTGAPTARYYHGTVWTGREMIVWGGSGGGFVRTGGRYDPATDTWTPTSETNAPTGRIEFATVWTGSEMIVFGGLFTNTGGRYNPLTDTWTPTSTVNAPKGCDVPGAVWTDREMVVWGGFFCGFDPTRGRYDPVTDTWRGISGTGAPLNRYSHSLIWTGQHVIIWGGMDMSRSAPTFALNDGALYDPLGDLWTPLSPLNAPSARATHTAVWTGDTMIVWGGFGNTNTGGRYRPATDSWTPTSSAPKTPAGRAEHTGVWTGSELIIWGGSPGGDTGARYDPLLDAWTPTSMLGAPSPRTQHTAVWTGQEMIIWGGQGSNDQPLGDGGRYDTMGDSWQPIAAAGGPSPRYGHGAIWMGSRMIVWGGATSQYKPFGPTSSGALYDPAADQWTTMSTLDAPAPRFWHSTVWTGGEMIVWGGYGAGSTGGRYDPIADTWIPTTPSGAPAGRSGHSAVWTGEEMIVWGASGSSPGGRYDPAADTWMSLSSAGAPAPSSRLGPRAVWTGEDMIVWGGAIASFDYSQTYNDGARYDPHADAWSPMTSLGAPLPRFGHTAVWTGAAMIVWGGYYLSGDVLFHAANPYVPWYGAIEPLAADEDGDGYPAVAGGDCDDGNAAVHPGAVDKPGNMMDEDCDGTITCNPAAHWRSHGAFVACVARSCARLVKAGVLTQQECFDRPPRRNLRGLP